MSETLQGVIIGASIALIGQLIIAIFTARSAHRRWLREQRIEAYREVAKEWDKRFDGVLDYLGDYSMYEPPEDFLVPLHNAMWQADMIASRRTSEKAWVAYKALLAMWRSRGDEKNPATSAARAAFVDLRASMRRDIGTGDPKVPPPEFD